MPSVAVAASETLNTSDATHTANLPRIFFGDRIAALAHQSELRTEAFPAGDRAPCVALENVLVKQSSSCFSGKAMILFVRSNSRNQTELRGRKNASSRQGTGNPVR